MRKNHEIYLILLLVLIFFLWRHPVLYPLRLMVVFFHEASHALANVITGGKVHELVVVAREGGHVISSGGNRFITLNAGYIGSLAWGVSIYVAAVATRWDRGIMFVLGAVIMGITVYYTKNAFGLVFGIATGGLMMVSGKYLGEKVNDFLLRLIGLTSMIYVPLDIYSDTISRSYMRSDAAMLAQEYGGTTVIWGGMWLFLSLAVIFSCFGWTLKTKKNQKPS